MSMIYTVSIRDVSGIDIIDVFSNDDSLGKHVMDIVTGLTFQNGNTVCILSSYVWRGDDFEERMEPFKGMFTLKEATDETFDLTFVNFTKKDSKQICKLDWYYGDGIYNFFFFDSVQSISQDSFIDRWGKLPPDSTIANRYGSISEQKIWSDKISNYMNEIGCKVFITTDSDNAELRICTLPEYSHYVEEYLESKGIKIKG